MSIQGPGLQVLQNQNLKVKECIPDWLKFKESSYKTDELLFPMMEAGVVLSMDAGDGENEEIVGGMPLSRT